MANTLAAYKQPDILQAVQAWWTPRADWAYVDISKMYADYIRERVEHYELDTIIGLNDFVKCLYKLGIQRISTTADAENQRFVQVKRWRPSDEAVMRFALKVQA